MKIKVKRICLFILLFFCFLLFISGLMTLFQRDLSLKDKVALVKVEGPIIKSQKIVDEINDYVKDKTIKAIVMRVDSPGGGVVAAQEIYEAVKNAASKKTIVVSMGAIAASGGYYISAPATRIIANPGTLTGSIGVIMEIPNLKGLMDKIGIKTEVIKSGRHKDLASVFRGIGDEERKILQGVMDDVHDQFIKAVSEGRRIPFEEVKKLSDGRVFSGRQALNLNLVDELGDLKHAINVASKLAGIKGEPEIITKKERYTIFDIFNKDLFEEIIKILPNSELKYIYLP